MTVASVALVGLASSGSSSPLQTPLAPEAANVRDVNVHHEARPLATKPITRDENLMNLWVVLSYGSIRITDAILNNDALDTNEENKIKAVHDYVMLVTQQAGNIQSFVVPRDDLKEKHLESHNAFEMLLNSLIGNQEKYLSRLKNYNAIAQADRVLHKLFRLEWLLVNVHYLAVKVQQGTNTTRIRLYVKQDVLLRRELVYEANSLIKCDEQPHSFIARLLFALHDKVLPFYRDGECSGDLVQTIIRLFQEQQAYNVDDVCKIIQDEHIRFGILSAQFVANLCAAIGEANAQQPAEAIDG